jgi:capsular exopolysaccharide synthesis family protein
MSKFFKALEQAERERVWEGRAETPPGGSSPTEVDPVASAADGASAVAESSTVADPGPAVAVEPPPAPAPRTFFQPPVAPAPRPAAPERPRIVAPDVDEHLVSLVSPGSAGAEQYRVLRHVVETLRSRASLQVVAVTSPSVGDGKTTTAINLAGSLAESPDTRVLLVDLDLRRAAVARSLGLPGAKPTLVDALGKQGLTLKDVIAQLPRFNLSVVPAPPRHDAPYELLRSPKLDALLDEARQQFDYVILDMPPFVPVPDCRLVARCVDGFLVVVSANHTPRGVLAETLSQMDASKAVGIVFNGLDTGRSRYYDLPDGSGHTRRAKAATS